MVTNIISPKLKKTLLASELKKKFLISENFFLELKINFFKFKNEPRSKLKSFLTRFAIIVLTEITLRSVLVLPANRIEPKTPNNNQGAQPPKCPAKKQSNAMDTILSVLVAAAAPICVKAIKEKGLFPIIGYVIIVVGGFFLGK